MAEREIDPEIIRGLLNVSQDLMFWLSEQGGPSQEQAAPLWKAFELLDLGLKDIMRAADFDVERDWLKQQDD